jgi:hypothetical protein
MMSRQQLDLHRRYHRTFADPNHEDVAATLTSFGDIAPFARYPLSRSTSECKAVASTC